MLRLKKHPEEASSEETATSRRRTNYWLLATDGKKQIKRKTLSKK